MIPSRLLVAATLPALALALLSGMEPTAIWWMLVADGVALLLGGVDAWLARPPLVGVERRAPAVMSLSRPNRVVLVVRSRAARDQRELLTRGAAAELLRFREGVLGRLRAGGVLVLDVVPQQLTGALVHRYLEIKTHQEL
jgi:hypothetical protein